MRRLEGIVARYAFYKGDNMVDRYLHAIGHCLKVFPENRNVQDDQDDENPDDPAA